MVRVPHGVLVLEREVSVEVIAVSVLMQPGEERLIVRTYGPKLSRGGHGYRRNRGGGRKGHLRATERREPALSHHRRFLVGRQSRERSGEERDRSGGAFGEREKVPIPGYVGPRWRKVEETNRDAEGARPFPDHDPPRLPFGPDQPAHRPGRSDGRCLGLQEVAEVLAGRESAAERIGGEGERRGLVERERREAQGHAGSTIGSYKGRP